MTKDEISHIIEWEGWFYLLTEVDPDEVLDAAIGEALADVQEAFRSLVSMIPIELDFPDDTSQLELNFE